METRFPRRLRTNHARPLRYLYLVLGGSSLPLDLEWYTLSLGTCDGVAVNEFHLVATLGDESPCCVLEEAVQALWNGRRIYSSYWGCR